MKRFFVLAVVALTSVAMISCGGEKKDEKKPAEATTQVVKQCCDHNCSTCPQAATCANANDIYQEAVDAYGQAVEAAVNAYGQAANAVADAYGEAIEAYGQAVEAAVVANTNYEEAYEAAANAYGQAVEAAANAYGQALEAAAAAYDLD